MLIPRFNHFVFVASRVNEVDKFDGEALMKYDSHTSFFSFIELFGVKRVN